jgi:O-antigen/teichoic acid export membrane protein
MRHVNPSELGAVLKTGAARAALSLAIKIMTAGLTFLGFVVLSRTLPGDDYGLFALGLSIATILAVGAGLGQQTAVLRYFPEDTVKGQPERAVVSVRAGGMLTLLAGLGVAILLVLAGALSGQFAFSASLSGPLWGAALLVPAMAFAEYASAALRAQGSVLTALGPRDLLWRVALPLCVLALASGGVALSGFGALLLSAGLLALVLMVQAGVASAKGLVIAPGLNGLMGYLSARGFASFWFFLAALIDTVALNFDTILIGFFVSGESAGVYFNAFRTAGLMTLLMYAANLVIGPMVAAAFHGNDLRKAQAITALAAWAGFGFSLLVFATFVLFGEPILSLFGPEFASGYPLLVLLSIGLLFDAATGPTRTVMMMTGQERAYCAIFGGLTLLGITLQAILIPSLGVIAAAAINMGVRIVSELVISWWSLKQTGIDPTIFGILQLRRTPAAA